MMLKKYIAAGLAAVLLAGCSFAPGYRQPAMPVPENLPTADAAAGQETASVAAEEAVTPAWERFFTDPFLQKQIAAALENNRDLRQSALTVESFQAQYRIQRAALLPSLSASPYVSRQRTFSGGQDVDIELAAFTVGITAYELDLFGRIRSLKDDTLEQYLAMAETHRSLRTSLVAEVARACLTLSADRELLAITEATLRSEEESHALVEARMKEGVASQIELAQSRTALENTRASLAQYRRQVEQDRNNLALLTGAGQAAEPGGNGLADLQPIPDLPLQLPSTVLLQRPDIIAAEHSLKAANASIGAARAAFFPTITLTANAGYLSADLGNMFSDGSETWLFSPSITVPIFTAGRLRAQLDVAELRKEKAVAAYEKAIQSAFREVADALAARRTYGEQLQARAASLKANQEYYDLARQRYSEGVDSYLTLLDAQRSLFVARQAYVATRLAMLANQVNLYKALGGGWQEKS